MKYIVLLLALFVCVACGGAEREHPEDADTPDLYDVAAVGASQTTATAAAYVEKCGYERWPVKTLADADAVTINTTPQPATVDALRALPAPKSLPQSQRIGVVERTVYTMQVDLVQFKQEPDGDVHVVVAMPNAPTHTMVVELPDAAKCAQTGPKAKQAMIDARQALIAHFGAPPTGTLFKRLHGTATITGVGFFDAIHGVSGQAPNGIELHPVLAISFQ